MQRALKNLLVQGTLDGAPTSGTLDLSNISLTLPASTLSGFDYKASVRAATTANITLSAAQTIDGISIVAGDRVMVKNQTAPAENGIYLCASGSWTRAADFDLWAEVPGSIVAVELGTANADTVWLCSADQGGTIGSTTVTFTKISINQAAVAITGGTITGTTVSGVTFSGSGSLANSGVSSLTAFTGSGTSSNSNTGDQTSIVGITGTIAQFNTACSDADFATTAGTETLTNKTLTAPKFASGGFIADANGNELLIFTTTASAINELTLANAASGSSPTLSMTGGGTDIGLNINPKGQGTVTINSGVTSLTTTSSGFVLNANSLSSGTAAYIASSSMTGGKLLSLVTTTTSQNSSLYGLDISLTGTNASAGYTSYGVNIVNARCSNNSSGTTNYGALFTVSAPSSVYTNTNYGVSAVVSNYQYGSGGTNYGFHTTLANCGSSGTNYGLYGSVSTQGTTNYGAYFTLSNPGSSSQTQYGVYSSMSNYSSGSSTNYGFYSSITNGGSSGTHYGVYSSVNTSGSTNYAGWFSALNGSTNYALYVSAGNSYFQTITNGTWNGTAISSTYGGTGLNSSASTGVPSISSGTWSVASTLSATLGGTGLNTSSSTGIPTVSAGVWSITTATGTGAPVRGTSPTITTPVITNINPGANFTLTNNSVSVMTSKNTGGVVNTLVLDNGSVGIGTSSPTYTGGNKLHVYESTAASIRATVEAGNTDYNSAIRLISAKDWFIQSCGTLGGSIASELAFIQNTDSITPLVLSSTWGLKLTKTITAAATTGAQTINKTSGSVNFAGGATSLVVTNSLVTTSSVILVTGATNDADQSVFLAVAAAGSFTIYPGTVGGYNVAPYAETRVNFLVLN